MAALADFDAVILAGGRAGRLAGADKPSLEVAGAPMLVSVARAAAAAGTRKLIVVGPDRAGRVHDALASLAAGRCQRYVAGWPKLLHPGWRCWPLTCHS